MINFGFWSFLDRIPIIRLRGYIPSDQVSSVVEPVVDQSAIATDVPTFHSSVIAKKSELFGTHFE